MAAIPGVAMARHSPMRAGNGNATAKISTAHTRHSQAAARAAARTEGTRSIRLQQGAAQGRVPGIGRDIARDQIAEQVGVGQFEKLDEGGAFVAGGRGVPSPYVLQQQQVQLFHAAPAAPFEPADFSVVAQSSSS